MTNCKKELDTVMDAFLADEFGKDTPLSGEFLLGYHCQKQEWRKRKSEENSTDDNNNNVNE